MNSGGVFRACGKRRLWVRALLASAALGGLSAPVVAQAQAVASERALAFDIPPQSVADALADFGRQSGLQVSVDADQVRGLSSQGVKGTMTASQALARLLDSTGLVARIDGNIVSLRSTLTVSNPSGDDTITLGALRVEGSAMSNGETGAERDQRQKDAVYDQDLSSTYMGREEVERYKGINPADVLKGMVNVFSGDARNSGAIDPSIRGIQGPGRVPVIIDGTEQALTVWRGYNGASNRSYIDPSLISGVQVLKGPVSTRDVNGSTGGAVVINTLDADDILQPDQTFGFELKLEGGNNSTSPRLPTLLTGQDYRTVEGFPGTPGTPGLPNFPYADPTLRITPRTAGDNEFLSLGDQAARIAVAGRMGDFDLFGAYAWRKRGNYFSGEHNADYYSQDDLELAPDTFVRMLGVNYKPGNEVPNTSSELESWLIKGTWRIADDQYLQLGFRDSRSKYGEIIPSRIISSSGFGNIQWPLSKVHAQAYNAEYRWQPESPWIDLKAQLWATHTVSDTYSAGGFPNAASGDDPVITNTALGNARNNRFGLTASNQMMLSSQLDLLLEGNWSHEKLRSDDEYSDAIANGWRQYPRAGWREEYRISLKGEWRPTSFLKVNAGLTYSGYLAHDDFLEELIGIRGGSINNVVTSEYRTSYQTEEFGVDAYRKQQIAFWEGVGLPSDLAAIFADADTQAYAANPYPFTTTQSGPLWQADAQGKYHRADNICVNGFLSGIANYIADSCSVSINSQSIVATTESKRKSGHGWAPMVSATAYLSGSSRAHLRYAEAYRFPSMFESTIGFSASINPLETLQPEHIYSWEAAYVQDLRDFFGLGAGQHADLKLTWYRNTTRDVIERSTQLMFFNLEKQVIEGLELQARFDNGRFFTEIGAAHMLRNSACDASFAILKDPSRGRVPDCVKYGFVSSYLLTQATPEDTINWSVGGRFLDRRLEIGGRLIWYSAYDNPQLDEFIGGPIADRIGGYALNVPYKWDEIVTLDAYATFRLNDRFTAELVGTNLTDRYYLDPLSRSLTPAPGRTVRLSLTGRF
ncbi:TonB-dependent receptor [Aurantiacibacter xanthus]|uniref:TonB-dependent receptor n=1 Tax=Aurantiacibacter xanthus TaxID=1784712 RepID=A0A3A1P2F7_9SPHN|nr:TonB-dependent receptor [Aurantiacibacter xanthus]